MTKRTNDELYDLLIAMYDGKYEYNKDEFDNRKEKITIFCKVHNNTFKTMLHSHLYHKKGCPQCSKFSNTYRKTQKEFEDYVESIFPGTYDFSDTKYVDEQTFVYLRCKKHDQVIEIRPQNITRKSVCCFKSSGNTHNTKPPPKTNSQKEKQRQFNNFVVKANKIHNHKYDYSKVEYDIATTQVIIICKEHGEFLQKPKYHLAGHGCQKCGIRKIVNFLTKDNFETFVLDANKLHSDMFEYYKESYVGRSTKTKIRCKKCNKIFFQTPYSHINGCGCPSCKSSKGEKLISRYLKEYNFEYTTQYKNITCKRQNYLPFDFSLNFNNEIIGLVEYNGIQHYEVRYFSKDIQRNEKNFQTIQQNDLYKQQWAKDNDIPLLVIKYDNKNIKTTILYFYILCLIAYLKGK